MTRNVSRSIRKRVFEIAATIAILAVLVSCISTYRALDELPQIQRRLVARQEQLANLEMLRSALAASTWRIRVLSFGDDEKLSLELAVTVSGGQQLIEQILKNSPEESIKSVVIDCGKYFSQLEQLAPQASGLDGGEQSRLRDQGDSLGLRLQQQADEGRGRLEQMRESASGQRRQAVYRLFGGHAFMLVVIGLLYVARLTERRRRMIADRKLLDADERFALIVRGSADGIILTDGSGRIQMTNPALDAMFATEAGPLKECLVSSLFETTVIDEWLTNRLHENHEPVLSRTVIGRKTDGGRFNAELSITPRKIRGQEFLAISVRDVSEREVSRLRLRQHEALLREIPEPLHIIDSVGRIIYWNVGAQRLFGYEATEAIGQSANDLLKIVPPEGDRENVHASEYAQADRWTGELQAVNKEGRSLRIERRRTRITEGDDTIGEVIFDLDLGERKRLQKVERRRQRLEALGTLASGIAHDLNNLLTPILMSSRMMQRGGEHLDRAALLETIVAGASRGAELISQLLTFARGGEGQHVPVDVGELLAEVTGILEHTLEQQIDLVVSIEPNLPRIIGDPTEISQVLMNLAINARDAMPENGTLEISAKAFTLAAERTYSLVTLQPDDYVAISVSDTGVGIPQSIRDRIFDPFFSTKARGQGTGLGLSTSLGILRSHCGAIDVTSTVGKGTKVTVILPTDHGPNPDEELTMKNWQHHERTQGNRPFTGH